MRFTGVRLRVGQQERNTGPPSIARLRPERMASGHPARLIVTGANLHDPVAVWLVGPLPEYNKLFGLTLATGRPVPWPFDASAPVKLLKVREENPSHISASVPPTVAPGTYALRIQTSSHRGHPVDLDHVVRIAPKPAGLSARTRNFLVYFGVMGFVFLIGMLYAWRQGDVGLSRGRPRRNLLWMVGGLLFYVVLIGSLQFWLSDWL